MRKVLTGLLLGIMLLGGCQSKQSPPAVQALASVRQSRSGLPNRCHAYGGGQGWGWSVIENKDTNGDRVLEYSVQLNHYYLGRLDATLDTAQRVYSLAAGSASFGGTGTFKGRPSVVFVHVWNTGGIYGKGVVSLQVYDDPNRNGIWEAGEARLFYYPTLPAVSMELSAK